MKKSLVNLSLYKLLKQPKTNLFIDGFELFAVAAPWCIKLNQDVLLLVIGNFIEFGGNQDLDGVLIPVFGEFLGKKVLLQFAVQEKVDGFRKSFQRDLVFHWLVLGHLVFQLDDSDTGNLEKNLHYITEITT